MKNLIKWFLKGWGKEFQEDFSEIPGFPGFPGGEMKFQENSRSSRFSSNRNNPDVVDHKCKSHLRIIHLQANLPENLSPQVSNQPTNPLKFP